MGWRVGELVGWGRRADLGTLVFSPLQGGLCTCLWIGRIVIERRFLSSAEVRVVYDRVGEAQDKQAFYEAPAVEAVIAHGAFGEARSIAEIGCGTGRVATRLLQECGPEARYVGVDVSGRMVEIAQDRLGTYGDRVTIQQTDGTFAFGWPDASQDRVVATYVLDLLSPRDVREAIREVHRVLRRDGYLCLAGLTWGERLLGRLVSVLWSGVHRVRPEWVGGCRPLRVRPFLDPSRWAIEHYDIVRAWGIPSEVIVASPR